MLVHNFVTQHQIFSVGAAEIFLGANQLSSETVGAAPKTQRRTSGAAKAWIPHWNIGVPYEKERVGVRFIFRVNRGLAPTPGAGEIPNFPADPFQVSVPCSI